MKKMFLIGALLISSISSIAHAQSKPKTQVCYGDQGVDIQAPYVLTIKKIKPFQADLITEDLLVNDTVSMVDAYSFEPAYIYILSVNPHTQIVDDAFASNKLVDRQVRRSVAALLKKYKITASGFALECNGTVMGLPRAGGMN